MAFSGLSCTEGTELSVSIQLLLQSLLSASKDPSWKRESEFHVLISLLQLVSLEAVF